MLRVARHTIRQFYKENVILHKGQVITSEAQLAPLVAAEPVQHALDAVIGALGDGGEQDDDEEDDFSEGGYTMEEVAKHNKNKGDVWVVLNGRVLNVSNFLSQHPGGELAILFFCWQGYYSRVRYDPSS